MKEVVHRRLPSLLPLSLAVLFATHFSALGWMSFFGADEPRYARVGQEMLLRGDLVTPTLNFQPWLEKPPLLFWAEALSFRIFGVSEATARFPVALMGSLCALGCGVFMASKESRRTGYLAFLILVTSPLYIAYSRAASTDMPLVAAYSLAMLSTFLALERRSLTWSLLAGLALGMALLAKGPVAVVLFAGSWIVFGLFECELEWSWRRLSLIGVLGLLVAFPWYWLVWLANGYDFIVTFFVNHHLIRFLTPIHRHHQPFWFFPAVILLAFFPWSIFLVSNIRRHFQHFRRGHSHFESGLELFLWIWVLVPLIFFSISNSKLAGYILPAFPALAMIVALEWDRLLGRDLLTFKSMRMQAALVAAISVILALAMIIGARLHYKHTSWGVILGIPVVLSGIGLHFFWQRRRLEQAFLSLVLGFSVFAGLAYAWVGPDLANFHSAKALVLMVKSQLSRDKPLILYRYFHHTALYYSDYQALAEPLRDMDELYQYFEDHPQKEYFILAKLGGLADLTEELHPAEIVQRGNVYLVTIRP